MEGYCYTEAPSKGKRGVWVEFAGCVGGADLPQWASVLGYVGNGPCHCFATALSPIFCQGFVLVAFQCVVPLMSPGILTLMLHM